MICAILIVGPKWGGKITTAEQHANTVLNYKTNILNCDVEVKKK